MSTYVQELYLISGKGSIYIWSLYKIQESYFISTGLGVDDVDLFNVEKESIVKTNPCMARVDSFQFPIECIP